MTPEEIKQINDSYAKPYVLSFTAEEVLRVKNKLACTYCFEKGKNRRQTNESRCGKCQNIAAHIKENKVLTPKLF
jgi:Zn finger protein HypA/HybF involved in hydrogenase expression